MTPRRLPVPRANAGVSRKKRVEEPVILTLSSDEEDDEKPNTNVRLVSFCFYFPNQNRKNSNRHCFLEFSWICAFVSLFHHRRMKERRICCHLNQFARKILNQMVIFSHPIYIMQKILFSETRNLNISIKCPSNCVFVFVRVNMP